MSVCVNHTFSSVRMLVLTSIPIPIPTPIVLQYDHSVRAVTCISAFRANLDASTFSTICPNILGSKDELIFGALLVPTRSNFEYTADYLLALPNRMPLGSPRQVWEHGYCTTPLSGTLHGVHVAEKHHLLVAWLQLSY